MAQKVTVAPAGDVDGSPADETVRFGFEGADYAIDLSSTNAGAFGKQLTPFIQHASKAGQGPARRGARTAASRHRSAYRRFGAGQLSTGREAAAAQIGQFGAGSLASRGTAGRTVERLVAAAHVPGGPGRREWW